MRGFRYLVEPQSFVIPHKVADVCVRHLAIYPAQLSLGSVDQQAFLTFNYKDRIDSSYSRGNSNWELERNLRIGNIARLEVGQGSGLRQEVGMQGITRQRLRK
jgi:hypothetical protein